MCIRDSYYSRLRSQVTAGRTLQNEDWKDQRKGSEGDRRVGRKHRSMVLTEKIVRLNVSSTWDKSSTKDVNDMKN